MADDVRFTRMADGREVAFRVLSDTEGPVIVHTHDSTFPMEMLDDEPMYDRFLRTLGQAGRLVVFDKPGVGASDPFARDRDYLDQLAEAFVAVLDAVEAPAGWLCGTLTTATVLMSTCRSRLSGVVSTTGLSPASSEAAPALGALEDAFDVMVVDREPFLDGPAFVMRGGDAAYVDWVRRAKRSGASAADRRAWAGAVIESGLRVWATLEPFDDAPPVLQIRRRDAPDLHDHEFWLGIFPDAESVTIEGTERQLAGTDAGLVGELMAGFIAGSPVRAPDERELLAVLFTDLVDSTPSAVAAGDTFWRATLDRYETMVARTVDRHHGTLVKRTGDGALATFPSGSQAIDAAIELGRATQDLGLDGRTGIHVGEVEQRNGDIGGIAVHLASRVMGEADPGQIVVTSAVEQVTIGTRFRFDDLGPRRLKGIERPWNLFSVGRPR